MFGNLIESGSHTKDIKRKSTFFLGTLALYAVLLLTAGVGSIYAYNARLEEPDLDLVMIMRFPPTQARVEPERREASRPAASASAPRQLTMRPEVSVMTPYREKVASRETKEVRAREVVAIGRLTIDAPEVGGIVGPTSPHGGAPGATDGNSRGVTVDSSEVAPSARVVKTEPVKPPAEKKTISLGVINGKAISKPVPVYTQIAKMAKAQGLVTVQILVDEHGRVVSAQATGGHALLRQSAVQAAYQARFTPTLLSRQPVKVSGIITYNFVIQ